MGSKSCSLSIVQHQNSVCMLNGGRSLGNDKDRRISFHISDRFSKRRIRRIVEGRRAVVQNQDLRLSDKGTGNGQTLSLTAG